MRRLERSSFFIKVVRSEYLFPKRETQRNYCIKSNDTLTSVFIPVAIDGSGSG